MREGQLNLRQKKYELDMRPIDENCNCSTCQTYTRSYLHHIVTFENVACSILSVHNIAYQLKLMNDIRESIKNDKFPEFIYQFMAKQFQTDDEREIYKNVPKWIVDALKAVNIQLA